MEKPQEIVIPANPKTLGEHIRKVRIERGLSQKDLVRLFKTSKDLVTCWENGRRNPQVRFYPAILNFLQYNPFVHALNTIPGKLVHIRVCNGYSVKEFAKIIGVDAATVGRWERGRGRMHLSLFSFVSNYWNALPNFLTLTLQT